LSLLKIISVREYHILRKQLKVPGKQLRSWKDGWDYEEDGRVYKTHKLVR